MNVKFIALIGFTVLPYFATLAYETDTTRGYIPSSSAPINHVPNVYNESRIQKFNLALDFIGIPRETPPDFSDFPEGDSLALPEMIAHLPYIDPSAALRRYLDFSYEKLSLFQDFFSVILPKKLSKKVTRKLTGYPIENPLEYSVVLNSGGTSSDSEKLIDHLKQISSQVKDPSFKRPLQGFKVVIDPGHMGTDFWDHETGKYVEIKSRRVSEGQINLWTSLLVANELEDLGATVILTRTQDGPVSKQNHQNFLVAPFLNQYFYDSLDDWMEKYLFLDDSTLAKTIKNQSEVKNAYSSIQHQQFYITGEDLEARSQIIDDEHPDLVLDVHFDANFANQLQNSSNALEAFVPGAFQLNETGSRRKKGFALKHLLEVRRWRESVNLASDMVNAMSFSEKVPLQKTAQFITSLRVVDGVYARNLYIPRRNLRALTVYLECLHYDHTSEFYRLSNADQVGIYHGISFAYPARLTAVVSGITNGLLHYFKH